MESLCRQFGVSKQAYYKRKDRGFEEAALWRFVVEYAETVRREDPGIGGEKLWVMYRSHFGERYSIGRDAFLKVLRIYNLLLRKPKKSVKTTDSRHNDLIYPDLVKDLLVEYPNQVWVSDITYVRTAIGFCFLFLITDAYTRELIGWKAADNLEAANAIDALAMACGRLQGGEKIIHHSDRGKQYTGVLHTAYLKENKIEISMTQDGNPKDNAIAERINGTIKTEFLNHHYIKDLGHLNEIMQKAVDFYNNKRPHRSLDMQTPAQMAQKSGHVKKRWNSYKDKYRQPCAS